MTTGMTSDILCVLSWRSSLRGPCEVTLTLTALLARRSFLPKKASPRLRIDAFLADPYFCPWKYQEQINMGAKETAIPAFAARLYERTWVRYNQMSSSVPVSDILRDP